MARKDDNDRQPAACSHLIFCHYFLKGGRKQRRDSGETAMVGGTPGGLAKAMGGSCKMEGRYRPWEDEAAVGGGSAVGGG